MTDVALQELTSVLAGRPSRLAFRRVASLVRRQPGLFGVAAEGLGSWPDEARCAPWSSLLAIVRGHPPDVGWPLARTLEVEHPALWWWDPFDGAQIEPDVFGHLAQIRLSRPGPMLELMCGRPELFGALRVLRVGVGTGEEPQLAEPLLATSALCSQLEELVLGDRGPTAGLSPGGFESLIDGASAPASARSPVALRRLVVRVAELDEGLAFLERNPLPALRELELRCMRWGNGGVAGLGENARQTLRGLERLVVSGVGTEQVTSLHELVGTGPGAIGLDVVNADGSRLAASGVLATTTTARLGCVTHFEAVLGAGAPLRSLFVSPGDIAAVGAAFERDASPLDGLRELRVRLGRMADYVDAAERILRNLPASVRRIAVFDCAHDGDRIARALAASGRLGALEALELDGVSLSADALGRLLDAGLDQLRTLVLGACGIGDEGAHRLARASFPALEELELRLARLSDEGLSALSRCHAPRLARLDVANNDIEGASARIATGALPHLRSLRLSQNPLTGAPELAPDLVALCRRLWSLDLSRSGLSAAGLRSLAGAEPSTLVALDLWASTRDRDRPWQPLDAGTVARLRDSLRSGTLGDLDALVLGRYRHFVEPWQLEFDCALARSALRPDDEAALTEDQGLAPSLRASLTTPR